VKHDSPARIVLIEDNPGDVLLLRFVLDEQRFEYQLEVLDDGEQALHFVRDYCGAACGPSPCVLVLDLHLPKYDGFEVLKALRQEPALSGLRVVALTGSTSPEEETRLHSFGVQLYRRKPTDLEGMLKLGKEIIEVCKEHVLKAAV
jgi:chemotaxis family two-component system response regulator Rcp1